MQQLRFIYTPEGNGKFEFEICTDDDEKIGSDEVAMLREAIVGFFVTLRMIKGQMSEESEPSTDAERSFMDWLKNNGIKD